MDDTESKLTEGDIAALVRDPTPESRARTAARVAAAHSEGLGERERDLAEQIFRLMLRDAETRVRKALSESLQRNARIPRDVALGLAEDVAEVAAPILQHSQVLTEQDLIDIVGRQGAGHQIAVAKRSYVSAGVAAALAESDSEEVVATLVANEGAEISETTLQRVLDRFGESEAVHGPMVHRASLPVTVAERLVSLVSESLREHLVATHDLPADIATDLVLESREKATVALLKDGVDRADVVHLVDQLASNKRLTPTLVLRAICVGDMSFFEAALARLCDIPVANAYQLINDRGDKGLTSLCRKAGLPDDMLPFIRLAVDVARETDYDGLEGDRQRFVDRMIQRVLTASEDAFHPDNVDYLLARLRAGSSQSPAAA